MMLSIVIPLYNKEGYILDTLSSLRGIPNIEILIVDNNSTDASVELCEKEAETNHQICILKQPKRGVSAARNKGLEAAQGDYVCFLDADDWYKGIENACDILDNSSLDILVFGFEKIDDQSLRKISTHQMTPNGYIDHRRKGQWLQKAVDNLVAYNVSNKIYRTDFLRENSLFFNENFDRLEDLSFFLDAYAKAEDIEYTDGMMHQYRTNMMQGSLGGQKRIDYSFVASVISLYRQIELRLERQKCIDQISFVEAAAYQTVTREMSTMRLRASLKDNNYYNTKTEIEVKTFFFQGMKKWRVENYFRYWIATRGLLINWLITRIRWKEQNG